MIERMILEALQKAVTAAVAACTMPTLPIGMTGRTFNAVDDAPDGKWLEVIYIPNNPNDMYWDSGKVYRGMLRLILHWPLDDKGNYEPLDLAASISAGFAKDSVFTVEQATVRINENPNLLSVLSESPEALFPISVRYQCFKA